MQVAKIGFGFSLELQPTMKNRKRDKDEQKILDKLCIERWKKAEKEGKIKYLSKRKWFYDFD